MSRVIGSAKGMSVLMKVITADKCGNSVVDEVLEQEQLDDNSPELCTRENRKP